MNNLKKILLVFFVFTCALFVTKKDGLTDYQEVRIHNTDPLKTDSDNDGYYDDAEIYDGKNPKDSTEHPAATLAASIELGFIAKTNTSYLIQASPDLIT